MNLSSDELRFLTQRASSFMQIEYLVNHKLPFTLDIDGTPCVRCEDVKYFYSIALTCELLLKFRIK